MIDIKIDKFKIVVSTDAIVKNHLRKMALREKELVIDRTPSKSGKLKNDIGLREITDGFEIHFKHKYGKEIGSYQHFGTDDHFIEPVNKQALHWDDAFSKGHKVSGVKALKFFEIKTSDKPILRLLLKQLSIFKRG